MGPGFEHPVVHFDGSTNRPGECGARVGEDPNFKEVVPTSASSKACWKIRCSQGHQRTSDSLLACKQPGLTRLGCSAKGGLCGQGMETGQTSPPLRADLRRSARSEP